MKRVFFNRWYIVSLLLTFVLSINQGLAGDNLSSISNALKHGKDGDVSKERLKNAVADATFFDIERYYIKEILLKDSGERYLYAIPEMMEVVNSLMYNTLPLKTIKEKVLPLLIEDGNKEHLNLYIQTVWDNIDTLPFQIDSALSEFARHVFPLLNVKDNFNVYYEYLKLTKADRKTQYSDKANDKNLRQAMRYGLGHPRKGDWESFEFHFLYRATQILSHRRRGKFLQRLDSDLAESNEAARAEFLKESQEKDHPGADFEIISRFNGVGKSGHVHKVRRISDGVLFAFKVANITDAGLAEFKHEMKHLKNYQKHHIATVETFLDESGKNLLKEWVDGETLRDILINNPGILQKEKDIKTKSLVIFLENVIKQKVEIKGINAENIIFDKKSKTWKIIDGVSPHKVASEFEAFEYIEKHLASKWTRERQGLKDMKKTIETFVAALPFAKDYELLKKKKKAAEEQKRKKIAAEKKRKDKLIKENELKSLKEFRESVGADLYVKELPNRLVTEQVGDAITSFKLNLVLPNANFAKDNKLYDGGSLKIDFDILKAQSDPLLVALRAQHRNVKKATVGTFIDFTEIKEFGITTSSNGKSINAFKIKFNTSKINNIVSSNPLAPVIDYLIVYVSKDDKNKIKWDYEARYVGIPFRFKGTKGISVTGHLTSGTTYKNPNAKGGPVSPVNQAAFEPANTPVKHDVIFKDNKDLSKLIYGFASSKKSSFWGGVSGGYSRGNSSMYSYGSSAPSVNSIEDIKLAADFDKNSIRKKIWELTELEERPDLATLIIKYPELFTSSENPFRKYYTDSNASSIKKKIDHDIPLVIASFQKTYPEAIIFGLGRDIYHLLDAVDAAYMAQGKPGKVKKLKASAPSFSEDHAENVAFLKSSGFDFAGIAKGTAKAHLMFDVTSYGHALNGGFRNSQSTQLMEAAYNHLVEEYNMAPEEISKFVQFVSVSGFYGTSDKFVEINNQLDMQKFHKETSLKVYGPKKILKLKSSADMTYPSLFWHGVYRPFVTESNGEVISPAGSQESKSTKIQILGEQWEIIKRVMNEKMVNKINAELVDLKVDEQVEFNPLYEVVVKKKVRRKSKVAKKAKCESVFIGLF